MSLYVYNRIVFCVNRRRLETLSRLRLKPDRVPGVSECKTIDVFKTLRYELILTG